MPTARKLPSGSYRCRVYIKGHTPEYVSFTAETKKEAEFQAAEYARNWKAKAGKGSGGSMTLGEATDKYIANRSAILSPTTIRGYRYDRTRYLQSIMDISISDLTQEEIQAAINLEATTLSPKTVRNLHGLLSAVLADFRPDFKLRTSLPAPKKRVGVYVPVDADIKRLLAASQGTRLRKAILLGACATMRRSEISALLTEDIDPRNNQILVRHAMVLNEEKKWVIKSPKTYESARVVDVPAAVISELLLDAQPGQAVAGITPYNITSQFCKLRNKLGIRMRFHDLRAYSASVQHALGVPDVYIMKQGGWSTDYVMKKIYRRAMEERAKEAAAVTTKHFSKLLEDSCE